MVQNPYQSPREPPEQRTKSLVTNRIFLGALGATLFFSFLYGFIIKFGASPSRPQGLRLPSELLLLALCGFFASLLAAFIAGIARMRA
jgi:hypothetical protein